MSPNMDLYGAVELGGTKTLVAVGSRDGDLGEVHRVDTGDDPGATAAAVVERLAGAGIRALGISSFGPLDLRPSSPTFGSVLATPKAGWQGHNLLESIAAPLGVPVSIDTDVNGAALAEGLWGASVGVDHHAYVTVGTGIGAGLVRGGKPVQGLSHPEFGHLTVARRRDDTYEGACPYHGDCLEGLAAGPALLGRFGAAVSALPATRLADAVDLVAFYVAQGVAALVYTVSPERVVIGGGVSRNPGFHLAVREALVARLAGYGVMPEHESDEFVVEPGLGDRSGLIGGLALAAAAVSS